MRSKDNELKTVMNNVKNHKEQIEKAEQAVAERKGMVSNAKLRQRYHFMPEEGWLNDPNGLVHFRGKYHYFYQYNPYSSVWGAMHWGHAVSEDLLHWEYLPIALAPSEEYDYSERGGCFSGSAIEHNDILYLMYTGATKKNNSYVQSQCIAYSKDGINFTKHENNPVIYAPDGYDEGNFRDPKIWKHDGYFYMVCGAKKNDKGQALLYKSKDILHWEYVNVLAESRGEFGYMWECPDLFSIDGKDVLVFSPMGAGERKTIYLVGDLDYYSGRFHYTTVGEVDWGFDYYAPQSFIDSKNRRIIVGWSNSWSWMPWWHDWGLTVEEGWCGFYGVPREVRLECENTLSFKPVIELETLRSHHIHSENFETGKAPFEIKTGDNTAFEIKLRVDLKKSTADQFQISLRGYKDEKTILLFDLKHSEVSFNRNQSDGHSSGINRGPLKLKGKDVLDIHIFSDRVSIELFANNYQTVLSGNIYPKEYQNENCICSCDGVLFIETLDTWGLTASVQ